MKTTKEDVAGAAGVILVFLGTSLSFGIWMESWAAGFFSFSFLIAWRINNDG